MIPKIKLGRSRKSLKRTRMYELGFLSRGVAILCCDAHKACVAFVCQVQYSNQIIQGLCVRVLIFRVFDLIIRSPIEAGTPQHMLQVLFHSSSLFFRCMFYVSSFVQPLTCMFVFGIGPAKHC